MSKDIEKYSSGTEYDEVKSLITDLCQIIEQAVHGEEIVATVSRQLQNLYSYGYTPGN